LETIVYLVWKSSLFVPCFLLIFFSYTKGNSDLHSFSSKWMQLTTTRNLLCWCRRNSFSMWYCLYLPHNNVWNSCLTSSFLYIFPCWFKILFLLIKDNELITTCVVRIHGNIMFKASWDIDVHIVKLLTVNEGHYLESCWNNEHSTTTKLNINHHIWQHSDNLKIFKSVARSKALRLVHDFSPSRASRAILGHCL
jgi:hypothetical protein